MKVSAGINVDKWHEGMSARLRRHICYLSKGEPSQPQPDPAIGAAAVQNAEVGKEMVDLGRDQFNWNKDRYAEVAPQYQKLIDQQIQMGDANMARANQSDADYNNIFRPNEARVAEEASNYGGDADQKNQAGQAIAGVTNAFDANDANQQRARMAMGVNPNDAKFQAGDLAAGLSRATAAAGAGTKAATDARLMGMQMRQNVAQFGRNMPTTSLAQDSAALSAGNSAAGNISGQTAAYNAGVNSSMPWYNGSVDATNSSGNLGLGNYNAQLGAWRTGLQADAAGASGVGNLIGTGLGLAFPKGFADGGLVDAQGGAPSGRMRFRKGPSDRATVTEIVIVLPGLETPIDPDDGSLLTADGDRLEPEDSPGLKMARAAALGFASGGIVRPTEPGMFMAAAPAMPALRSGGGVVEGGAPLPDNREGRIRYFAEGGLIDMQEPAPVEDRSTRARPEDIDRLAPKRTLLPKFTPRHTAFTDDFDAFAAGGLVRANYDRGGVVDGPGSETSDSIPAQLSNNEGVLNAPAVRLVGEDFVNRINAAGLAMAGRPPARTNARGTM